MPDIMFTVREKIAQVQGTPEIVCGNSDYAAVFDFDSEWDDYDMKTARFVWRDSRTGEMLYSDSIFTGNTAPMPPVYNTFLMLVGVYAGNIRTTTPARIPCAGCITDSAQLHPEPAPDIYEQLLAYLEEIVGGSGDGCEIGTGIEIECGVTGGTVGPASVVFPSDCPFVCDEAFFFDFQVPFTIGGRAFHKKTSEYAVGVVARSSDYFTDGVFISPVSQSAVEFTCEFGDVGVQGSFEYDGLTWYWSQFGMAMYGDYTDETGNLQKYPDAIDYTSASDIKAILDYANAAANE